MNIKSLLLGSAAALVAVSGARAADAVVVAEPEPMDYVRICDTYGTGFYYIPGTETCLRIGGFVQYDIGAGVLGLKGNRITAAITITDTDGDGDPDDGTGTATFERFDTWYKRARIQLEIDARSETELGTLRGYAALNFQHVTANRPLSISLGQGDDFNDPILDSINGLSVSSGPAGVNTYGWDHIYIELGGFRLGMTDSLFGTFTGYQGGTINNDVFIAAQPYTTHQIAYTFTGGNGFSAAVALENGSDFQLTDDYVPHVVGGVGFTQGWGGVSVVGAYDAVAEEGAFKARLDVKASDMISLFLMAGYDTGGAAYATWSGDWAVWGGISAALNEKTTVNAEFGYTETEDFQAIANVAYELVPGFKITPEVVYFDNLDDGADGEWGGYLRFRRSF